jgi:hypothetical protein
LTSDLFGKSESTQVSRETCPRTEPFRPFRPKFLQRVSRERYLRTEPVSSRDETKKAVHRCKQWRLQVIRLASIKPRHQELASGLARSQSSFPKRISGTPDGTVSSNEKGPRIPPEPSANCRAVLFAPPSRRPWSTRFTRNLFNQCTIRTAK